MSILLAKLMLAAIPLSGVVGEKLRARAFFDANNVNVGDPLILTVDFLGEADFRSLHPPRLSKAVDAKDWKLDDASAKTDTYRDARRLTYRVRPMREGVLWFPALEFEYAHTGGGKRTVAANPIPVHAKMSAQVFVDMQEVANEMPKPPALRLESGLALSDDERFQWQKACSAPSSGAFRDFDFPAARLNEARMLILEGKWSEALKIYSRLEWIVGQTPEIEQGMVAALALKYDNSKVSLPVWRQIARPLLRYGWRMRLGVTAGALALLALLAKGLSLLLRHFAAVLAALVLALPAQATDIFEQMNAEMEAMRRQMSQSMGFGRSSFSFGGREEQVKITASLALDREELTVGDNFEFIVSIDAPKTCSLSNLRLGVDETFGLAFTGDAENLSDAESANPSNVVKRLSVPARYDMPFKGKVAFSVSGMVSSRSASRRGGGFFNFSFSNSFQAKTKPVEIEVKPLPQEGQPDDFNGVVADMLEIDENIDIDEVSTNDVVNITYTVRYKGFLPEDFKPEGSHFEISRERGTASFRRFFVADGAATTPEMEIKYYFPAAKEYRSAKAPVHRLKYK